MVRSTVGEEAFRAEVLDLAMPETYAKAVTDNKLHPVTSPDISLTSFDLDKGLVYEAVLALIPEVKLGDISKIKVKPKPVKVEDKEIDTVLEELQKSRMKSQAVDRPAKLGDRVEIDFEGFKDGIPFEGGKSQNHPMVLGEGLFIPGFEEALVGVKAGEEREFPITFPAEYQAKHLAGQEVVFKTKTHVVHELTMPELDANFAEGFGAKSVEELKKSVVESLEHRKGEEEAERQRSEALEALVKASKVEIPEKLIKEEAAVMLDEFAHQLSHQGADLDQYLHSIDKSKEDFMKEVEPQAEQRIKSGLVLGEYANTLDLKVDDAEAKKLYENMHEGHDHGHEETEAGLEDVRSRLKAKMAMDKLVELAVK
jgi:trigger factor